MRAWEIAEGIYTHWLYDPVLKGEYPHDMLEMAQAAFGVPEFHPGDAELLKENIVDFIGLNYYKREMVARNDDVQGFDLNTSGQKGSGGGMGFKGLFKIVKIQTGSTPIGIGKFIQKG